MRFELLASASTGGDAPDHPVTTMPTAASTREPATSTPESAAGDQEDSPARQQDQRQRTGERQCRRRTCRRRRSPGPGRRTRSASTSAQDRLPATLASPADASPSSTTGAKVRRRSSAIGASSTSASKQVRVPVWQAGPSWSTLTSSVSPSQSSRTSLTHWRWPEVSPLTQYSWRLRLQYVARPEVERPGQRLVVHPAEHQHLERVVLLHDGGHQAVGRALEAVGDAGVERGRAPKEYDVGQP